MAFFASQSAFLGEQQHDVASNPVENAAFDRRCVQVVACDKEEVTHRALGEFVGPIEEEAVECAGGDGFSFGQNVLPELVALMWGESASGKLRFVRATVSATPVWYSPAGSGARAFAMMTTVGRAHNAGSSPISPSPREMVMRI